MTRLRRLGWVTVGFTYFLVLVGGLVRITNSGEGCPDWPTCHGSLIPPLELHTDIEYSHRFTASVVSFLVIALTLAVLIWARQRRYVIPTMIAVGLLIVQIILGGITVLNDLPQNIITAHLGTALALFGTLIVAAVLLGPNAPVAGSFKSARRFARLALTTAILTYLLLLSGSNVRGNSADLVCPGWPLCGRTDIPSSVVSLVVINLFHRFFASFVGLVIIATIIYAWRRRREAPRLFGIAIAAAVFFVIQVAVGGIMVTVGSQGAEGAYEAAQGFHLAFATAVWGSTVALAAFAYRDLPTKPSTEPPSEQPTPEQEWVRAPADAPAAQPESAGEAGALKMTVKGYINLMKPHVTVLLLGVTLASMAIAQAGFPPWQLVIATLFGGACAAGSANAINCYFDRDIDQVMSRTRKRSLPSGRILPTHALIFGIVLAALSFVDLALFVNLLSALLAFSGILFYIFVYTLWLKRTSTQNIVIGGAAGAVPPLVGWAAVTHSVGLPAIWLFAIIFYWTPPHFWALALLIKNDYARAHIPMMPVVLGEKETKRQIVLYTLLLIAVTLVLFSTQAMGFLYLASAISLGAGFLYLAIRVWRDETKRWARTLFWYSNCYLALLFALMVIDRVIS
ncbi:MAG TPA: heme o synthase [Ktedonobacterales bacterium]|nr:heme o synthase [Ktedonobacterales bacterium]